jgi:outer membrane protein OmpA-like peptidoglycan-associated protein
MNRASQWLKSRTPSPERAVSPNREARLEQEAHAVARGGSGVPAADFSRVRVRTDAEANQAADSLGARAVTSGRDILFGTGEFAPGTRAGQELMAHELAHVAQQTNGEGPGVQFDPKNKKAGLGAAPPEGDFIKDPDNWGSEDQFLLFEQDNATLDAADEKTIQDLVAAQQQKEPLYIHVHGYASKEGPDDYNLNLSAHRSVAVKTFLDGILPAGSKVVAFAHGESKHFGGGSKNRRVGISLMGTVTQPGFHLQLGSQFGQPATPRTRFTLKTPPITPPPPPIPPVTGVTLPPGSVVVTPGPAPFLHPIPSARAPLSLMANADILAPFALHGVAAASRADIIGDWTNAYFVFRNYLPENFAAKAANSFLSAAYQAQLERTDPNAIERGNAEFQALFPDDKRTPILPIITPIEILTGKDLHTF